MIEQDQENKGVAYRFGFECVESREPLKYPNRYITEGVETDGSRAQRAGLGCR